MKDFKIEKFIAEDIKKGLSNFNAATYVVQDPCPICGGEMRAWRTKKFKYDRNGKIVFDEKGNPVTDGARCKPVCVECGNKKMKKREAQIVDGSYKKAKRSEALDYLRNGSLYTNSEILGCTFVNYKEFDDETKKAKEKAMNISDEMLKNNDIHAIILGPTGVGKTHLSMAIVNTAIVKSDYSKKCLFISYRELLEQLRFAMSDEETRKAVTGATMKEIKLADIVVIDDFGSELGNPFNPAKPSNYDIDTATSLFEARENKSTIVTSNLNGKQLKMLFGDRVFSRLAKNVEERSITFINAKDKRIYGTGG